MMVEDFSLEALEPFIKETDHPDLCGYCGVDKRGEVTEGWFRDYDVCELCADGML